MGQRAGCWPQALRASAPAASRAHLAARAHALRRPWLPLAVPLGTIGSIAFPLLKD
jgi:hypothetical protein